MRECWGRTPKRHCCRPSAAGVSELQASKSFLAVAAFCRTLPAVVLLTSDRVASKNVRSRFGSCPASPQRQARASGDGSPLLGAAGSPSELRLPSSLQYARPAARLDVRSNQLDQPQGAIVKRTIFGWMILATLLVNAAARADDWPQWLGPKRDGVWRETGLLDKFPEKGPKLRWRADLAHGYSGPAVAQG